MDVERMRRALARLKDAHPVVCSRLEQPARGAPYWHYRRGEPVTFVEAQSSDDDPAAVCRYAERLFEKAADPREANPIEFHLLHMPDGRDVLMLRWWHALMDGKAPEYVIHELNRLAMTEEAPPAIVAGDDAFVAYLRSRSRRHRARCVLQTLRGQFTLPYRAVTLMAAEARGGSMRPVGVHVQSLSPETTQRVAARTRGLCGFVNYSAAMVSSVFRALRRLSPGGARHRTLYQTDLPLNLRPATSTTPIFHNLMTFIHLSARPAALDDRDALVRSLNAQMREQLRRGVDVGNAQLAAFMARFPRLLRRHIAERWRHRPLAVNFGFQGPLFAGVDHVCGTRIEQLSTLNTPAAPPGLTIQANLFGGGLNFNVCYSPTVVSEALVREFVVAVEEDLVA